jgi:hypothetical protein
MDFILLLLSQTKAGLGWGTQIPYSEIEFVDTTSLRYTAESEFGVPDSSAESEFGVPDSSSESAFHHRGRKPCHVSLDSGSVLK